jgi:hypothetical protein
VLRSVDAPDQELPNFDLKHSAPRRCIGLVPDECPFRRVSAHEEPTVPTRTSVEQSFRSDGEAPMLPSHHTEVKVIRSQAVSARAILA